MIKRLLLCLLILAAADGSKFRQNDLTKIRKIFGRNLRPRLPFPTWHHQYRIDPWYLRWPGLWRLGSHRNDLNIASVKRRRGWTKYRTRRSKWSKLYSKQHDFNKVSKHTSVRPWSNHNSPHQSSKEFSKTLESASYYAIPSWLQTLRNELNHEQNKVDALHSTFTSDFPNERYPKVTSLRWNERRGQTSTVLRQTSLPPKSDFQPALFEKDRLLGSFSGTEHVLKTQAKFSLPQLKPNQASPSHSLDDTNTADSANGFHEYSSGLDGAFYPSGDASDVIKTSESAPDYKLDDLFSSSKGKTEIGPFHEIVDDKMDEHLMPGGEMTGSSGESWPEFASDHKISSGSSFGHTGDPVKPAERSSNPNLDDGFGSFGAFPNEDYLAYADFDESGFGTFGGFAPHDDGFFLNDNDNCEGIDSRSCKLDTECSCMGMYFCLEGSCSTISTSSDHNGMPAGMKGIWHEAPMAVE